MALCNENQLTNLLKRYGYNAVLHPREGIAPLTLLEKQKKVLSEIGNLKDLILSDKAYPEIVVGSTGAKLSGKRSSEIDIDLGLTFLSSIFSGLGLPINELKLKNAFSKSKKLVFSFDEVTEDKVLSVNIDTYISAGKVNPDSNVYKQRLHDSDLYIITSVVKSKNFTIESLHDTENEAEIKLPEIQDILSADIKIDYKTDSKSVIEYKGSKELIFGFRAIQLIYKKEKLKDLIDVSDPMRSDGANPILSETGFFDLTMAPASEEVEEAVNE